jgi:hypothetical protein
MEMNGPRLRLNLGLLVRRRTDPGDAAGLVVAVILRPSRLALVRWRSDGLTFERLDDLVEVHGLVL